MKQHLKPKWCSLFVLTHLFFAPVSLVAQKHDNVWVFGYHYYPSFVPVLDFYYGTPDTAGINSPLEFMGSSASISNSQGDLLFYTNGTAICNFNNDTLPGTFHFNFEPSLYNINANPSHPEQSVLILPQPGYPAEFSLFHLCGKLWNNNQVYQPVRLGWSIINMNGQQGQGYMFQKDSTVFTDTLMHQFMQSVRHANGRDWWIVNHKWRSDLFYTVLLTPNGIDTVVVQQSGPIVYPDPTVYYTAQSCFSPDGSKFVLARSDSNQVMVFDFDRCSGLMSFVETINIPLSQSTSLISGCSFSPDSRRLYVSTYTELYQYDMWSGPVSASQFLVDTWDGVGAFNPYYFTKHRIGPDGKIYIFSLSSRFLHVINEPDLPGSLCQFTQHSLRIKSNHSGRAPDFPNYRLGPLAGSVCDSLTTVDDLMFTSAAVSAYPNPAGSEITFSFDLEPGMKGELEIIDMTGRIIRKESLSAFTTLRSVDLSGLEDGVYLARVRSGKMSEKVCFIITGPR